MVFTIDKEQPPSVSSVNIKSIYPSEDYDKQRALLYVVLAVVAMALLISSLTGRFESGIWSLLNTQQMAMYMICISVTNVPDNTVRMQDILSPID